MTHAVDHKYEAAVDENGVVVFNTQGNLWGFLAENNSTSDIYLQFFDAASLAAATSIAFTVRLSASSALGKDADEISMHHFKNGCVVKAVNDARNGSALSVTEPTINFWYSQQ